MDSVLSADPEAPSTPASEHNVAALTFAGRPHGEPALELAHASVTEPGAQGPIGTPDVEWIRDKPSDGSVILG
ncbi:MAG: hypothetical protein QOK36_4125 [Gaiellales bacterium]|nr:hypothetical protein [Gaiellales bacterium]